jgi:capsular exopolysaccharide synthesis family protein
LREQEAQLDRKVAELASEYGAKHPRMINARAEMRDLRDKIEGEVNKIVQSFRNKVSVVRARENSLLESLDLLQQRVAELNSSEVQLRALQREAKANRDLYETFLSRFKETSTQEDMQQIDARIITRADLPSAPSFPNKRMIIALVFVSSIFLGIVLAFAMEHIDHGFRSMEQIERLIGAPALGLVPAVGKSKGAPEKYAVEKPTSMLGEAVRTIYTALVLSNVDTPPRVVLVTSALPKEGKTTTALLLGRLYAMLGKRAIIIDTDLRRPQVHLKLDLPEAPGLVELLTGKATPEEVIRKDEASGADVIVAGKAGPNAAELLSSDRLKSLLSKLGEYYDLVVLDSPPTMAVADARVLAHIADRTILVIRWAATRREIAAMAVKHILDAGGTLAGIVLSRVNIRKHASYGYGDSGYYYGPARKYYGG